MQQSPIAIVGISALFPGGVQDRQFWRAILSGRDLTSPIPENRWLTDDYSGDQPGAIAADRGGFIDAVHFSPLEFGIPPDQLSATDSSQLLALLLTKRLIADLGQSRFDAVDRQRVGVVLGMAAATELAFHTAGRLQAPLVDEALRRAGLDTESIAAVHREFDALYVPFQEASFPGLLANVTAGRIANRFDLGGTNRVVDAACASALAALETGIDQLRTGRADLMITGGIDLLTDAVLHACFSRIGALSPSGRCRPFDADADGTILGEGMGLFALKRLGDAKAAGDPIYAIVAGVGSSSDGRAKSIYAPRASGQARAIQRAYDDAGYAPQTVGLIEAHGTATIAGDRAELKALHDVFTTHDDSAKNGSKTGDSHCALGSLKSQIGHTRAAAGAAGLFKATLSLSERVLPPTANVERPTPELLDSPFYLSENPRPWIATDDDPPRRAGISASGFGGTNYHVTLQAYSGPHRPPRRRSLPAEICAFSAPEIGQLIALCQTWQSRTTDWPLPAIAWHSQEHFDATHQYRLAIVTCDPGDLRARLATAIDHLSQAPVDPDAMPPGISFGADDPLDSLAFLFPGQGSQYINMGAELALYFDRCREIWEASGDLHRAIFPRPAWTDADKRAQEENLRATEIAQPAIGTTSATLLAMLHALGLKPTVVAGHSYGELTALYAAGVLSRPQFLALSRQRGQLMADQAHTPGAMTAAAATIEQVRSLLASVAPEIGDHPLTVANHNAPHQVVISGHVDAIAAAESEFRAQSIPFSRLNVDTAFHSPIVADAQAPFGRFLESLDLAPPKVPVFANTEAGPYGDDPDSIRAILAGQLTRPVRFVEMIDAIYDQGTRVFLEVGPKTTLTSLVGQCLGSRSHQAIALDSPKNGGIQSFFKGLASLTALGFPLNFKALWTGYETFEDRPSPPAPDAVKIGATIYDKPYPGANPRPAPKPDPRPTPRRQSPHPPSTIDPSATASEPTMSDDATDRAQILAALREQQAQTAEAHRVFQETTAAAHREFLRTMQASFASLSALDDGSPPAGTADFSDDMARLPPPPTAPNSAAPASQAPTRVEKSSPDDTSPNKVADLLLDVVADKTGYPAQMLNLDMSIEADLGVDSIKQVEILSAIEDRYPQLPPIEPTAIADLQILGRIANHISRLLSRSMDRSPRADSGKRRGDDGDDADDNESDPAHGPSSESASISRYIVADHPARAAGWAMQGLHNASELVVLGASPALVEKIRRQLAKTDYDHLAIVAPVKNTDQAPAAYLGDALMATRGLAESNQPGHLIAIDDRRNNPWQAGLSGLAKTAAAEWPDAAIKAIDLPLSQLSTDKAAALIVGEITAGGPEIEISFDEEGQRFTPICTPKNISKKSTNKAPKNPLSKGDIVVVSGGARGVTAASIIALAARFPLHFILLGRTKRAAIPSDLADSEGPELRQAILARSQQGDATELSPRQLESRAKTIEARREIAATIASLEQKGAHATYCAVDIRDAQALSDALDKIRDAHGPIAGLIHGAGVIADSLIADKTRREFDAVFQTKVGGLRALLDATEEDPLKLIALFSSVAARSGNPGQSDYAMANEVLNHVALDLAKTRRDCTVKSIGWGPWEGGMVDASLAAHFRDHGVTLIPPSVGAQYFADEITGDTPAVETIIGATRFAEGFQTLQITRPLSSAITINEHRLPHIRGHQIRGVPVVPAMVVLEWFTRFAQALRPDRRVKKIAGFQVLQGIKVDDFQGSGMTVTIAAEFIDDSSLELSLRSKDRLFYRGRAAYSAGFSAGFSADKPRANSTLAAKTRERIDRADELSQTEGDRLFHSQPFQTLERLIFEDDENRDLAYGKVQSLHAMDWPRQPWQLDPAALDGALQLCLIWGHEWLNKPTIIMAVDRITNLGVPPGEQASYCRVRRRDHNRRRFVVDIDLFDHRGQLTHRLETVAMYAVDEDL